MAAAANTNSSEFKPIHVDEATNGYQHVIGSPEATFMDLELNPIQSDHLINEVVFDFSWQGLNVQVNDRKTKKPLSILSNSNGTVRRGEMLAIMGPSGSGKTTLLNALAMRTAAAGATTNGDIMLNGQHISRQKIRELSSYVEQEDALIGSLTVRETMQFSAGLALSRYELFHSSFQRF